MRKAKAPDMGSFCFHIIVLVRCDFFAALTFSKPLCEKGIIFCPQETGNSLPSGSDTLIR